MATAIAVSYGNQAMPAMLAMAVVMGTADGKTSETRGRTIKTIVLGTISGSHHQIQATWAREFTMQRRWYRYCPHRAVPKMRKNLIQMFGMRIPDMAMVAQNLIASTGTAPNYIRPSAMRLDATISL